MPRALDEDIEDYKSEPYGNGRSIRVGREIEDEELAEQDMRYRVIDDDDIVDEEDLEQLAEDDLAHMEGPDA